MATAFVWAKKSYCKRSQVGAVLAKDGRIISTGYNGTISGETNNCEDSAGNTVNTVVHAEENVIAFAAKYGISTEGCTLYTTLSPCDRCAKLLIQAGITTVVYADEYRNTDGLNMLKMHGMIVEKYNG